MRPSGTDTTDFETGFIFAIYVVQSLGLRVTIDQLCDQLKAIQAGEVTLIPSDADAIAGIEHEYNKPLPEALRQSVRRILRDRATADAEYRDCARIILEMMGD